MFGVGMKRAVKALFVLMVLVIGAGVVVARFYPHKLPDRVANPIGLRPEIAEVRAALTGPLTAQLESRGLIFGAPVFMRIFKEEAELELWVRGAERFELFKTYPICNYSGALGPKLREGDRQSPEGFYKVGRGALNPNSSFHLSFNLGFPNAYDATNARTGSFLMVHGDCVSIGCYAMTDAAIEEIYVLAEAALLQGQAAFDVHAFPFRMSEARMAQAEDHAWIGFWEELKPGYDAFETSRQVPEVSATGGRYDIVSR